MFRLLVGFVGILMLTLILIAFALYLTVVPVSSTNAAPADTYQVFLPQVYAPVRAPTNPGNPAGPAFFLPGEAPTRNFEVAYDQQGRLHLAFVRHTRTEQVQEVVYGQCAAAANCDTAANWQTIVIHSGSIGSVQLRVTNDGRPRIAIMDEYTTSSVRLAYMECEAGCLTNANWQGIALGSGIDFGEAFGQHIRQRWFAIDTGGRPHMIVSTSQSAMYLTCSATCATTGDGWSVTNLDTTGDEFLTPQLFEPAIAVAATGQVHIFAQNSRALVYLTCAQGCDQAQAWQRVIFSDQTGQSIRDDLPVSLAFTTLLDLQLDPQGAVVVAFSGVLPIENGPARSYLWRCSSDCGTAANWAGRAFSNTYLDALTLAIDSSGKPYFVSAGQVASTGERVLELSTCTAGNCFEPQANWNARKLSSSNDLEAESPVKTPLRTPAVCTIATTSWEHTAQQLIWNPAGKMRLITNATAVSICQPGMEEWIDQWGTKKRGRTVDVWVIYARARWVPVP
ncbi:MAG: hypothetical protein Fur005_23690 [Roseiflexaceae bacterium]